MKLNSIYCVELDSKELGEEAYFLKILSSYYEERITAMLISNLVLNSSENNTCITSFVLGTRLALDG